MASRNKDERAYVNALVKAIQKNSPNVYVYIDRDAGAARHTSSGWDFSLAYKGRVVYCEAKVENGKLTAWQEFTRADIIATGTPYLVVRFWDGGTWFGITIDNKMQVVNTTQARISDFIK